MLIIDEWLDGQPDRLKDWFEEHAPGSFKVELNAEFERRDKERRALSDEVTRLIIRAARAEELQKENEALRTQLKAALDQTKADIGSSAHVTPAGSLEKRQEVSLGSERYLQLLKNFNVLVENEKVYRHSIDHFKSQNRHFRSKLRAYERHNDIRAIDERLVAPGHHNAKFVSISAPSTPTLSSRGSIRSVRSGPLQSSPREQLSTPSNDSAIRLPSDAAREYVPTGTHSIQDGADESTCVRTCSANNADDEILTSGQLGSSQSTVDDTKHTIEMQSLADVRDASGVHVTPFVILNGTVKSYSDKAPISRSSKQSEGPTDVTNKKGIEDNSATQRQSRALVRTLTMDLDDVGAHLFTPRKRTKWKHSSASGQENMTRTNRKHSPQGLSNAQEHVAIKKEHDNIAVKLEPCSQEKLEPVKWGEASHPHPAWTLERQMSGNCNKKPTRGFNSGVRTDHTVASRARILRPISPNVRHIKRERQQLGTWQKIENSHAVNTSGSRKRKATSDVPAREVEGINRLQGLLTKSTPRKEALTTVLTPQSLPGAQSKNEVRPRTRTPQASTDARPVRKTFNTACMHFAGSEPSKRNRLPQTSNGEDQNCDRNSDTPTAGRVLRKCISPKSARFMKRQVEAREQREKERVPLRQRSVQDLKPNDFKHNPDYLGHRLQNDVVRDRHSRRCLPGCLRSCCAGAFRAMVEAGAKPEVPRSMLNPSPPEGGDGGVSSEEHRLLQHHLGKGYTHERIESMPADEIAELIIRARTKLLSDRHGRHKRIWERQKSPPGFWRNEMPSSQENERDKEQSRVMERETVQERWEDAMRGGGRWIFRDEF